MNNILLKNANILRHVNIINENIMIIRYNKQSIKTYYDKINKFNNEIHLEKTSKTLCHIIHPKFFIQVFNLYFFQDNVLKIISK
jgi:hypothetical protein